MAKRGFETTVESVEMFVDASGAVALIRVDGLLFSLSLTSVDREPMCNGINVGSSTSGYRVRRAAGWAQTVFKRDVLDHLTPAYIEKNRAVYAD